MGAPFGQNASTGQEPQQANRKKLNLEDSSMGCAATGPANQRKRATARSTGGGGRGGQDGIPVERAKTPQKKRPGSKVADGAPNQQLLRRKSEL